MEEEIKEIINFHSNLIIICNEIYNEIGGYGPENF